MAKSVEQDARSKAGQQASLTESESEEEPDDPIAGIHFGTYHALVIGNDDYRYSRDLRTAENDAKAVSELLESDYGFEVMTVPNATREEIPGGLWRNSVRHSMLTIECRAISSHTRPAGEGQDGKISGDTDVRALRHRLRLSIHASEKRM